MVEVWKMVWWCPLLERKTGLHRVNFILSRYGTAYRWKQWREVILEQSEDLQGRFVQTVRLPNGEEIVRKISVRSDREKAQT